MELSTCFASPEIYYSLACFTYILSGVFGAIIRWCHMCHPYSNQGDYFYPARRQVAFFYGAVVLQFPYVLCPSDPDAWFFARSFGIIFYPICFAVLFFRYFRTNNIDNAQNLNKKAHYLLFILSFLLLIVMFFLVIFRNGDVLNTYQKEWEYGLGGLSLLLSYSFMRECWWLSRKLDEFNIQNYSNEDDFPYVFAKKVLWLPLIGFIIMWIVFLSESREIYMGVNILMAVFMVFFLCQILHPNKAIRSPLVKEELECMEKKCLDNIMQRNEDFKTANSTSSETNEKVSSCQNVVLDVGGGRIDKEALLKQMAEKDWEAVKKEVLTIVSRRYLEPSLKRVDVIRDVTLMKHTLAGTFITQVGFYKLVNAFRVRHYERLMETSNSNLSQDMAAEMCGFKNRWALSNARKRLEGFDYSLIEEYFS